jgi:ankyrin repeat protein
MNRYQPPRPPAPPAAKTKQKQPPPDTTGMTPLMAALTMRDDDLAANLVRAGAMSELLTKPHSNRPAPILRAAGSGMFQTVKLALEAGVHPDDPEFFGKTPLLSFLHWYRRPERVQVALEHGASPDTQVPNSLENAGDATISCSRLLVVNLGKSSDTMTNVEFAETVDALTLLLHAKPKSLDSDSRFYQPANPLCLSAAWLLASSPAPSMERKERLAALIPLLKAAGADIDTPCGLKRDNLLAPIVAAVRWSHRSMVEAFIAAGARTDDAWLMTRGTKSRPGVGTLFHEVEVYFGEGQSAWAQAAYMRKVIDDTTAASVAPADTTSAPSANDPVAPAIDEAPRRRRMGV